MLERAEDADVDDVTAAKITTLNTRDLGGIKVLTGGLCVPNFVALALDLHVQIERIQILRGALTPKTTKSKNRHFHHFALKMAPGGQTCLR